MRGIWLWRKVPELRVEGVWCRLQDVRFEEPDRVEGIGFGLKTSGHSSTLRAASAPSNTVTSFASNLLQSPVISLRILSILGDI